MREILFRGKRIDNGEWAGGNFYESQISGCYILENKLLATVGGRHSRATIRDKLIPYEVDPSTVGQYTGLKDKNGKRIFEGDIVEYNDNYDYFKGKVVFELGAFGIGNSEVCQAFIGNCDNFASLWDIYWEQEPIDAPELYYCTIVGNIHDNPELLEVR